MQITSVVAEVIAYLWAARACGPSMSPWCFPPVPPFLARPHARGYTLLHSESSRPALLFFTMIHPRFSLFIGALRVISRPGFTGSKRAFDILQHTIIVLIRNAFRVGSLIRKVIIKSPTRVAATPRV